MLAVNKMEEPVHKVVDDDVMVAAGGALVVIVMVLEVALPHELVTIALKLPVVVVV